MITAAIFTTAGTGNTCMNLKSIRENLLEGRRSTLYPSYGGEYINLHVC